MRSSKSAKYTGTVSESHPVWCPAQGMYTCCVIAITTLYHLPGTVCQLLLGKDVALGRSTPQTAHRNLYELQLWLASLPTHSLSQQLPDVQESGRHVLPDQSRPCASAVAATSTEPAGCYASRSVTETRRSSYAG